MAKLVAGHRIIALKRILVGASPGMMHPHGVIRSNGAIEEGPLRLSAILFPQFLKDLMEIPEAENFMFALEKPGLFDSLKHGCARASKGGRMGKILLPGHFHGVGRRLWNFDWQKGVLSPTEREKPIWGRFSCPLPGRIATIPRQSSQS
jgi:hypothetical protein